MQPISRTLLEDVSRACGYIVEDTAGMSREAYLATRIVRQAAERNLEIIGEGLIRLRRVDPATAQRISHLDQIIGLRNRLAHGYDREIDDEAIWLTCRESVPSLRDEIMQILTGP
jgi:uncharacterized protein with HEPN domain